MPFYEVVVDFGGTAVYTQEASSADEAERLVEKRVRSVSDWGNDFSVDYTSVLGTTKVEE